MSILVGFYDVIFGYLMEFIHLLFEVVEISLDRLIEHFFETELHETQMIVFYILLVLGGFLIFFYLQGFSAILAFGKARGSRRLVFYLKRLSQRIGQGYVYHKPDHLDWRFYSSELFSLIFFILNLLFFKLLQNTDYG